MGTNKAFQKVHGVVISPNPIEQRLDTKPLECKSSCNTANQEMEKSFSISDKTSCKFDIDEPTEEHANIEEGI